eukprot:6469965-Amphidinium_carterae.1
MGAYNERWRFSIVQENEVKTSARDHAFGYQEPGCVREAFERRDFPEIPSRVLKAAWSNAVAKPWQREKTMPILEGRCLVQVLRRLSRKCSSHGKRHLILGDSMAPILAVTKWRSSSLGMCRVTRQYAAIAIASQMYPVVRWVPSEFNAADKSSRKYQHHGGACTKEYRKSCTARIIAHFVEELWDPELKATYAHTSKRTPLTQCQRRKRGAGTECPVQVRACTSSQASSSGGMANACKVRELLRAETSDSADRDALRASARD